MMQERRNWFPRSVLHVKDVEASLQFYVARLGFAEAWRYEEDGAVRVAQVERQGTAIIVASTWPEKAGKSLVFISVNGPLDERENAILELDALRAEFEAKGVQVVETSWGYLQLSGRRSRARLRRWCGPKRPGWNDMTVAATRDKNATPDLAVENRCRCSSGHAARDVHDHRFPHMEVIVIAKFSPPGPDALPSL